MLIDGRPEVPPLDLDVVKCPDSKSSSPAQFDGETADGRPVFLHYRHGYLSVYVGQPYVFDDIGDMIYQARIGPPYHGRISLAQISELTGMRVDGKQLSLSEDDYRDRSWEGLIDFSGRRAYWVRGLQPFFADLSNFHAALRSRFPDLAVLVPQKVDYVRPVVSDQSVYLPDYSASLIPSHGLIGIGADKRLVLDIFNGATVIRPLVEDIFDFVFEFSFYEWKINYEEHDRELKSLNIAVTRPPHTSGSLSASFHRGRPESREAFETVRAIADGHFSDRAEQIDLLSGNSLDIAKRSDWAGAAVAQWCLAEPDRYLGLERREGRWIGWRPETL